METKYGSKEIWYKSLMTQRNILAHVKRENLHAKVASKIEHRIQRIYVAGLPEWRAEDDANATQRAEPPVDVIRNPVN